MSAECSEAADIILSFVAAGVVIYMPLIPQGLRLSVQLSNDCAALPAVIAMLACARLGAVHSVVFGGFAPKELAFRIDDSQAKLVLTASCGIEFDKYASATLAVMIPDVC